jgi:hypothetical protein
MEKAMHDEPMVGLKKIMVTVQCCWNYAGDNKWCPWSHGRKWKLESVVEQMLA